jgi:hypothetical protein
LAPWAFGSFQTTTTGDDAEAAALMYFDLTPLTTMGYGNIVAVDPFVRRRTNLEPSIGVIDLAIAVAGL